MKTSNNIIFLAALIVVSCTLRAPITGVGALVSQIRDAFGFSGCEEGMLTTIPLVAFGIVSMSVGRLAGVIGAGRVMILGLLLLISGIIVRSYAGMIGLFAGTAVIGIGLAVANVLVPAFIKARYPDKIGTMTSVYTASMAVFAALSGGISVPLANAYGWKGALFVWIALAVPALILWLSNADMTLASSHSGERGAVIKDPMAWQISLYMAVCSMMYYCFVAWFDTILQSFGFDKASAGYYNSLYLLFGIPGSILIPILAGKKKNQSALGIGLGLAFTVGLTAMMFAGNYACFLISLICCGFCSGACFAFAMALFGLHTDNAADTSALSGMAQSVGYILASVGPMLLGEIFDLSGHWTIPIIVLIVLALILTWLGYLVGRERIIAASESTAD